MCIWGKIDFKINIMHSILFIVLYVCLVLIQNKNHSGILQKESAAETDQYGDGRQNPHSTRVSGSKTGHHDNDEEYVSSTGLNP